jgi:hypothetical protein
MEWLIFISIGLGIATLGFYSVWQDEKKDKESAKEKLSRLEDEVNQIIKYRSTLDKQLQDIDSENKRLKGYEDDLNALITQRSKGFPLLGEVYAEYLDVQAKLMQGWLRNKKNPAPKAADVVKDVTKEKRELIKQLKVLEYRLKNYELIAPFLSEDVENITTEDDAWLLDDYTEEEMQDEVIKFLTKEEYRQLSVSDRNQLALDRYWGRGRKSLWTIGKMYEHYVGYIYENDGWEVEYFGIAQRYEDFGRDLIAKKGNVCHIVQCKNWSKYKKIYENHIFQLFGTTFEYQKMNPKLKVVPVFYTSTKFSDAATEFAKRLGIEVHTDFKLEKYPCIKCNIGGRDKVKIYHLPFDQQYDNTIIETKKGEFYCETVAEAEKMGFRRAFRWSGNNAGISN